MEMLHFLCIPSSLHQLSPTSQSRGGGGEVGKREGGGRWEGGKRWEEGKNGEENGVSFLSPSVLLTPPHDRYTVSLTSPQMPVSHNWAARSHREPRERPVFSQSLLGSSQYSRAKQDLFCSLCARVPGTH